MKWWWCNCGMMTDEGYYCDILITMMRPLALGISDGNVGKVLKWRNRLRYRQSWKWRDIVFNQLRILIHHLTQKLKAVGTRPTMYIMLLNIPLPPPPRATPGQSGRDKPMCIKVHNHHKGAILLMQRGNQIQTASLQPEIFQKQELWLMLNSHLTKSSKC